MAFYSMIAMLLNTTSARSVIISLSPNQRLSSQVNPLQATESKLMNKRKVKTISDKSQKNGWEKVAESL